MLDEKQSQNVIKQLLDEDKIIKPEIGRDTFFMNKSTESLDVARKLFALSTNKNENLKSFMWVIAASYYSMFFAATALLAFHHKKIDTDVGVHKTTYHALVYYFHILDKKLQKHFIEAYKDNYDTSEELLQISERKALELLQDFKIEQGKRKDFTYEMGLVAEEQKAKISLQRAENFHNEIRDLVQFRK